MSDISVSAAIHILISIRFAHFDDNLQQNITFDNIFCSKYNKNTRAVGVDLLIFLGALNIFEIL